MGQAASFSSVLEVIVVAVPIAVLLTLVALFLRRRKPTVSNAGPEIRNIHPAAAPLVPVVPAPSKATEAPVPQLSESAGDVFAKIEVAISNGEKTSLSALYLQLAAAHAREGDTDARMAALRSAAGNGALHGPHSAHAAARLALGEAAQDAGDLTSACEQWQLARTACLEGGDKDQHALIEKRMRDNGCPTDWVLTDF